EAEKSAEKAREIVRAGVVPEEADGALVKQLFSSGDAMTAISGPWLAADIPPSITYRVVPLPKIEGAGEMRPFLTVEAAFLTPEGAKRDTARRFARFLTDDESARTRADLGKQIVSTKELWQHDVPDVLRAFHDASASAVVMPSTSALNPAWDPAKQALRKILRGKDPPRDALLEA